MTLARDERTANLALALETMLDAIGDSALDEVFFDPGAYPAILTTTWDELLAKELVEPLPTAEYILTGRGWTAAVISTARFSDVDFKARIERLFAALKRFVKGRHEPATVSLQTVVDATALPFGWIFNIIEGKYMEEISKRRGASWVKPGRLVLIPVAFGIEPTDLRTLLHPAMLQRLEEVEEDLEAVEEQLSQYRCPYCRAELSSTGGYEIDERNSGYYEDFACGYSTQDGYPRSLCPEDPEFPAFEDFELTVHQNTHGEFICYARGKTPKAKLVSLDSCPGRTEEEARKRVKLRYEYRAGRKHDILAQW